MPTPETQVVDTVTAAMMIPDATILALIIPTRSFCMRYTRNNVPGDGNAGWYYWDPSSVATPDGNSIVACAGGGNWIKSS